MFPQVNPVLKKCLEEQGLKFVGQDVEGERMEIVELEGERGVAVHGGDGEHWPEGGKEGPDPVGCSWKTRHPEPWGACPSSASTALLASVLTLQNESLDLALEPPSDLTTCTLSPTKPGSRGSRGGIPAGGGGQRVGRRRPCPLLSGRLHSGSDDAIFR